MTTPLVPTAPPSSGGLHARRCARHPTREAAAKCPSCGEFFCRECVVEHDGRLLCSACLARLASSEERRHARWTRMRRIATAAAGLCALWLVFQGLGSLLLKIPPRFHDGTLWKELRDRGSP